MRDELAKSIALFRQRAAEELKRIRQQRENQRRREELRRSRLAAIGLRAQLRVVRGG